MNQHTKHAQPPKPGWPPATRRCVAAVLATLAFWPAYAVKPKAVPLPTPSVVVAPITPLGAPSGRRLTAASISEAIQLLQMDAAEEVEVPDDPIGREALKAQIKQPTRVRTVARSLEDLGGEGCKRIELAFIALDLPVQDSKTGRQGLWSVVMNWSLCQGGMPVEGS